MEIPTMKIEHAPSPAVKNEASEDGMSPLPEDDDIYEDPGDLDFSLAQRNLWVSHIPRSLWEAWSAMGEDEEIEIGTIRIEGAENTRGRVSLKLHDQFPQLDDQPKEYNLFTVTRETNRDDLQSKRSGKAFAFSEKDLPGYKSKPFAWNDLDEDGNPGQGRSYLYERNKREQKKRENKTRYTPYARRPIPKQTAIAGIVEREFDCVPVKNEEYFALEAKRAQNVLAIPERQHVDFRRKYDPNFASNSLLTMAEKASINKQTQARKLAAKENRAARVDRNVLIDKLLDLFKKHKIWALRDLKVRVNQPEAYLREVLSEIAFMWKNGDWTGKWELKKEYQELDAKLLNPESMVAPAAEESEMDRSGMDDDDENEIFEDV